MDRTYSLNTLTLFHWSPTMHLWMLFFFFSSMPGLQTVELHLRGRPQLWALDPPPDRKRHSDTDCFHFLISFVSFGTSVAQRLSTETVLEEMARLD